VKVLYGTTTSPWSTTFGGGIRSDAMVRGLRARHSVEIGFFTRDPTADPGAQRTGFDHIHTIPVGDTRARSDWTRGRAVRQRYLELVHRSRPDVVWCFHKDAARLVAHPSRVPLVIDLDGVSWHRLARTAAQQRGLERGRTLLRMVVSWAEERRLCQRANVTVLAQPDEARLLGARTAWRVCTIPNGADFSLPPRPVPRGTKRILHLGGRSADQQRGDYHSGWTRLGGGPRRVVALHGSELARPLSLQPNGGAADDQPPTRPHHQRRQHGRPTRDRRPLGIRHQQGGADSPDGDSRR
jgi:hypothetical protein